MAVQKSKKSPSKRGMRRSHQALINSVICEDQETGELHYRHHITASGYYKGKKMINIATEE